MEQLEILSKNFNIMLNVKVWHFSNFNNVVISSYSEEDFINSLSEYTPGTFSNQWKRDD